METKRYIGIDLHRNCFTACLRLENGREYLKEWNLQDLAKFAAKLRPSDQVAVEVTGNTRLFHDAVSPHVERIVAVNPSQFMVITHSVKKTDPNDARNLALYLAKDLLPEVRMKDKTQAQIASLTQTRDTMVKLRTALKTTLIQCALIAQSYSPYLKTYYEKMKSRRGTGKAIVALARKFLGIIYRTLKNQWVFEDFPNFVLAEEATA